MKDNFSLVVLPLIFCLVPLFVTGVSWRLERLAYPTLPRLRLALFRVGLLLSVVALLVTASCYIDPYPFLKTADGSLSIAWLERAWAVAFIPAIISMILALFGKGWPRVLLLVSGILSLVLAFGSVLQNGV
jgi:Mn2+/Fe2+ NRAMP family transporter